MRTKQGGRGDGGAGSDDAKRRGMKGEGTLEGGRGIHHVSRLPHTYTHQGVPTLLKKKRVSTA